MFLKDSTILLMLSLKFACSHVMEASKGLIHSSENVQENSENSWICREFLGIFFKTKEFYDAT